MSGLDDSTFIDLFPFFPLKGINKLQTSRPDQDRIADPLRTGAGEGMVFYLGQGYNVTKSKRREPFVIIPTKLHIPRPRTELISRTRLLRRLSEGLHCALTLVTSPAGYGKTTALGEWAMMQETPVAWVSLDQGDNDPNRFWTYTVAALKQACNSFPDQHVLHFLSEDRSVISLIAALVNALNRVSQPVLLIWDDIHSIEHPTIRSGIEYLLNHLPPHVHLYMAGRFKPALSLSRLRMESGLNHIDVDELRFDSPETYAFFAACGGIRFSEQELVSIRQKTEGWIAAMRLALLSVNGTPDPAALAGKLSGAHGDLADYFFEEVLSGQPHAISRFLLQTSILNRMTVELCEAVTGMAESATCLQALEQKNLFLVPLDQNREWYRYHHLFQQFLMTQLQIREPNRWQDLHISAARWLEENGDFHEAVHHYLSASQYEDALRLIESLAPEMMSQEWATLGGWLSTVPESLLMARPKMLLTKLAALYLAGQTEEATEGYWRAMRRLEESPESNHADDRRFLQSGLAFLAAIRTFLDRDFHDAVHFSKQYVEGHPEGDLFVGFGSDPDGYHPLWNVYVSDGSLRTAEQVLPALISAWSETRNVYLTAHLCIDFGKWHYERNHLNEAKNYMERALDLAQTHNHISLMTIASLWLARILAVRGDAEASRMMVDGIAKLTAGRARPQLTGKIAWFLALQGKLLGDEGPVTAWLETSDLRSGDEIPLSMIKEYNLLACHLADQGNTEEATALIERLLSIASQAGKQSDFIRLLVHKSIIFSMQGKTALSMELLEEALAAAWPQGYIRTFVDEGAPLKALVEHYLKLRQSQRYRPGRKVPLSYVKRLLRLFISVAGTEEERLLPESGLFPLTPKEREVLRLMKDGLSNKEIGEHLQVSLATVKTHINHIYGKLQVHHRLQALERAEQLKWL